MNQLKTDWSFQPIWYPGLKKQTDYNNTNVNSHYTEFV